MAENMSLADQVIQALSAVRGIDEGVDNDAPERHQLRSLKRVAERIISDAMRTAIDLAWQAKDLRKLRAEIEAANAEVTGRPGLPGLSG